MKNYIRLTELLTRDVKTSFLEASFATARGLSNRKQASLTKRLICIFILLPSICLAQGKPEDLSGLKRPSDSNPPVHDLGTGHNPTTKGKPDAATPTDTGKDAEEADAPEGSTEINVKNADIAAVIRIFSKKTKRNYILDERVKGKVSIYLPGKVSSEESLKILDSVLALKGFTSVPIGENLWKVVPSKEGRQSTVPTIKEPSADPTATVVTRIVQLKYVGSEEVQQIVQQLISADGLVNSYAGTNTLLLIDYEDNIQRIVDIIDTLDVPFTNRDMTIIPVENADAEDIAKKLNEILGNPDTKKGTGSGDDALDLVRARLREAAAVDMQKNQNQPNSATSGQNSAGKAQNGRSREPKIIPDQRTNSIIVVADDDTTARIRALVSQLDSPIDLSGFRFYVYRCQHANAEELADVLSGLSGEGGTGKSKSSSSSSMASALSGGGEDGTGFGGSSSRNTNSRNRGNQFNKTQGRVAGQSRTPGRSRSENGDSSGGPTSVNLGENISVTADKATNSLIVFSSKADYEKLRALLEQLDIKRRQVLVEAMILEVGVTDNQSMGFDFLTSTGGKDGGVLAKSDFGPDAESLANLLKNPAATSKFSVAAASAGTLTLPGGVKIPTQAVLLSAAQSNENVNVLSSPNILTTDNEEAEIVVGQNVPFVASRSTDDTNLNNTFNQIDRQDVGITLRLTPQISSKNFVTMRLFTEVSNVVAATLLSDLGPTTTIRTSETTVIARDGQMIVIGGLLSDDTSQADSGVPFLKDVPVLGHLFREDSESRRKTNLLIFITPRIVQDQFDIRDATLEKRDSLEQEIDARGITPSRDEVLRSESLDKVTESSLSDAPKPSTILPPEKEQHRPEQPRELSVPSVSKSVQGDSRGVIQLHVAPKLPSVEEKGPRTDQGDPRASLKQKISSQPSQGGRFVVMEIADVKDVAQLPFSWDRKSHSFGVEVPSDSSQGARKFFATGERFTYRVSDKEIIVTPIGTFSSREEAGRYFTDRSIPWYTLSPYEIMNLGQGPWIRK